MKRFLFPALTGALALALSAPALAEVVNYPGAALQNITCVAALNNVLTPAGATVAGQFKSTAVNGGNATTPTNTVTLNSGAATDPGYVFGAMNCQDGDSVDYNRVSIAGTVTNYVDGASHRLISNEDASVNNNQVTVSGGTVGFVSGGYATNIGAGNAYAIGNTVVITGGTITGDVRGGSAIAALGGGDSEARNNTVSISGAPTLTGANLYGGVAFGGTVVSTGNTLQIASAGLTVGALAHFQNFQFTLPASLSGGGTVLTTTVDAQIGTDSTVTISAPGLAVSPGNVFTLIDCGTCAAGNFTGSVAAASQNGTLNAANGSFGYTLSMTNNALVLRINPLASSATSVPVMNGGALVALVLLLAGLTFVTLRRSV
ncbi:MAG: hypothetical protein FWC38_10035 [Proteobacteria bacterium]|nr:hypothetical protein [Pseudomonadota bacterium]